METRSAPPTDVPAMLASSGRVGWEVGARDALGGHSRGLLRGVLRNPRCVVDRSAEVRAALRPLCEQARARELPVERLLILLKAAWRELPGPSRGAVDQDGAVIGRVISMCIEEYYEPGRRG